MWWGYELVDFSKNLYNIYRIDHMWGWGGYGMYFEFKLWFVFCFTAVLYAKSYYTELHYDGIWLYFAHVESYWCLYSSLFFWIK